MVSGQNTEEQKEFPNCCLLNVVRCPSPQDWGRSSESPCPSRTISILPVELELLVSESVSTLVCDLYEDKLPSLKLGRGGPAQCPPTH